MIFNNKLVSFRIIKMYLGFRSIFTNMFLYPFNTTKDDYFFRS